MAPKIPALDCQIQEKTGKPSSKCELTCLFVDKRLRDFQKLDEPQILENFSEKKFSLPGFFTKTDMNIIN